MAAHQTVANQQGARTNGRRGDSFFESQLWRVMERALVPLSIFLGSGLIAHEVRIAKLEESRFTSVDAAAAEARTRQWAEDRFLPAQWLRSDLSDIKQMLRSLDSRMREMEKGNR